MPRARGWILKLLISGALVGMLLYRYGRDPHFIGALRELDIGAFLLADAILAGGLVLSALRWKILLGAAGVRIGLGRATRLYFSGYFFNLFLPTTVGGDVVRAAGVGGSVPLSVVGSSILVERFLGFGCLLAIGLTASFLNPDLAGVRWSLAIAAAVFVAGLITLAFVPLRESARAGKVGRLLRGLRRTALAFRAYGFHPAALAGGLVLSVTWQLLLVAANFILAQGIGGVAPFRSLLAIVPIVQAVSMIPVSFGGLGVREVGYQFFFGLSGLEPGAGVALGAVFLGVSIALALKGGLVYLVSSGREPRTDG